LVFPNNIEGLEKLLVQMEALKVQYVLGEVVFGLEPTANYRKPFGVHLIRCGHKAGFRCWVAVK
jgi:transposase